MTVSTTLIVLALVYAAGIALGLLLAALLWFDRNGNHVANRWLAAAIGSLAKTAPVVGQVLLQARSADAHA